MHRINKSVFNCVIREIIDYCFNKQFYRDNFFMINFNDNFYSNILFPKVAISKINQNYYAYQLTKIIKFKRELTSRRSIYIHINLFNIYKCVRELNNVTLVAFTDYLKSTQHQVLTI